MPYKDTIVIKDGNVEESDKDKLTPTLTPAAIVEVKPVGDDGQPIVGANVTLECQTPHRIHSGVEQADGSYTVPDRLTALQAYEELQELVLGFRKHKIV